MPNQVTGVGLSEDSPIALVGQAVGITLLHVLHLPPADAPSALYLLRALRN